MARRIHDISPPITAELAVFPGDTPPAREVLLEMKKGDPLTLSTLRTTVHLGAHLDAPSHYGGDGRTIDEQDLTLCLGPCRVVRAHVGRGELITPERIEGDAHAERLLVATGTFPDPTRWNVDFAAFDPACIDWLSEQGVRLIGIDTPSVDLSTSKDLPSHHRALANDMAILEGIVLTDIVPGDYELIALPLRLVGFDASPVRAVLREV